MKQNTSVGQNRPMNQVPAPANRAVTFESYKAATAVPNEKRDGAIKQIDTLVAAHLAHPANRATFEKFYFAVMGRPAHDGFAADPGLLAAVARHPQRAALLNAQMHLIIGQANQRFAREGTTSKAAVDGQKSKASTSGSGSGSGRTRGGHNTLIYVDNSNTRGGGSGGVGSGGSGGSGGSSGS